MRAIKEQFTTKPRPEQKSKLYLRLSCAPVCSVYSSQQVALVSQCSSHGTV